MAASFSYSYSSLAPNLQNSKSSVLKLPTIWQNNLLLFQTLAQGGAKLNPKDLSLVDVAAEKGLLDIAKYLLQHGANPELAELSNQIWIITIAPVKPL